MHGVFRIGPLTDDCRNSSQPSLAEAGRAKRGVSEWHRMTADALKDCNKRDLARLAKERGIVGWHAMRKDQLIRALSLPHPVPVRTKEKTGTRPSGPLQRKTSALDGLPFPNGRTTTSGTQHPTMAT